jgi:hypothetical protein
MLVFEIRATIKNFIRTRPLATVFDYDAPITMIKKLLNERPAFIETYGGAIEILTKKDITKLKNKGCFNSAKVVCYDCFKVAFILNLNDLSKIKEMLKNLDVNDIDKVFDDIDDYILLNTGFDSYYLINGYNIIEFLE